MVKAKYNALIEKLENLMEKHDLVYELCTEKEISMTVKPKSLDAEQTSFIEDNEEKSSGDAAIKFIFRDGAITISTTGKLFITESLINKLKTMAKKLHYLFLQTYWEESQKCDAACEDCTCDAGHDQEDAE